MFKSLIHSPPQRHRGEDGDHRELELVDEPRPRDGLRDREEELRGLGRWPAGPFEGLQDVQQRSQNYAFMLYNLMTMIQEYLLLSDDDKQRGALKSLDLVGSTAQLREDNRICIWLEDVWSER